jgi:hypothetical protein
MSIGYIIRQVIAALLVPFCLAAAIAFGDMMLDQGPGPSVRGIHAMMAIGVAAGIYAILYIFLNKTVFVKAFDTGPVQTMWGTVTGYNLPSPAEGEKRAEVPVDSKGRRVPLWAAMAPYLFPIWTIIGVLAVYLIKRFIGMSNSYYAVIQAAVIGFTYCAHAFMVVKDITTRQPALRSAGTFFTLVLLFLFNIELLAALAMLVFNADFVHFNREILHGLDYEWFWEKVQGFIR